MIQAYEEPLAFTKNKHSTLFWFQNILVNDFHYRNIYMCSGWYSLTQKDHDPEAVTR